MSELAFTEKEIADMRFNVDMVHAYDAVSVSKGTMLRLLDVTSKHREQHAALAAKDAELRAARDGAQQRYDLLKEAHEKLIESYKEGTKELAAKDAEIARLNECLHKARSRGSVEALGYLYGNPELITVACNTCGKTQTISPAEYDAALKRMAEHYPSAPRQSESGGEQR